MALLDLQKLTAGLSQTWAGFLRDWDRSLRSGNFPWFATRRAPGIPGPDPAPFIAVRHERDETQQPSDHQPYRDSSERIEVDGEVFDVVARPDPPGQVDYTWISGPNPGYGFSSASSDGGAATRVDHVAAIRSFLSQVDPATGYIE
jgi:hypothetical protein